MKKFKNILASFIIFSIMFGTSAAADDVSIYINGKIAEFTDVQPYIDENDRTMVPLRFIGEELKAEVEWNDEEQKVTVSKDGSDIELKIGESKAYVGEKEIVLDTAAVIKNDRTMVPLRFIGESLGVDVSYNETDGNVYISSEKKQEATEKKENERKLNNDTSEGIEEVNVLDFGADPTGVKECTSALKQAHNTKKRVYYPNGKYRFNGENLDLSGGVRFESQDGVIIHNDVSDAPIVVFDDFGNLIGLQQNHLENITSSTLRAITSGNLVEPPMSEAKYETKVDFIPFWYNDFGLECTRLGRAGSTVWYTWDWNYHAMGETDMSNPQTYWPERHPLLGFYRGDDPVVLDWQCYWLAEYGVKGAIILPNSTLENWEDPGDGGHWVYQLFNNAKNFKNIQYAIQMPGGRWINGDDKVEDTRIEIRNIWKGVIERTYLNPKYSDNVYCVEIDGGRYPVISLFEELQVPGMCDAYQGGEHSAEFYKEIAQMFKDHGFDGFAVFARHWDERIDPYNEELKAAGVYRFIHNYEGSVYAPGKTYEERVKNFSPSNVPKHEILGVSTGNNTHWPHPSQWVLPGNTPELFGELIEKSVDYIEKNDLPKIITCYNMAEWAEGGPGIQPNVQDRFGYLDAIKNAVVK